MNQHDISVIVPIVVIVGLAAWALYRQRRAGGR
jgi:hypothetical protein